MKCWSFNENGAVQLHPNILKTRPGHLVMPELPNILYRKDRQTYMSINEHEIMGYIVDIITTLHKCKEGELIGSNTDQENICVVLSPDGKNYNAD